MPKQMLWFSFALAVVLTSLVSRAAEKTPPPGRHVWDRPADEAAAGYVYDHRALSIFASDFKREVIEDSQAHSGKAVQLTGTSKATHLSLHRDVPLTPGKYRTTVRLRILKGGRFRTDLEVEGRTYFNRTAIDFGTVPADGSYVERSVDGYLPGMIRVVSLRGALPDGLVIDEVTARPVPDAAPVELVARQAGKLVYQPNEAASATIFLINHSGKERTTHLRVTAESGLMQSQTVADKDISLAPGTQFQKFNVPLPALSAWGHQLRAELIENGKVVSSARDICAVSSNPLSVGQYGVFGGGDQYEAKSAESLVKGFRANFQTAAEICFWAPCDMSQLVPPPGKDRWWSGQTLQKFSTEQIRTYINKCHAQGISARGPSIGPRVQGGRRCTAISADCAARTSRPSS